MTDDTQLLEQFAIRGDEDAFRALIDRHLDLVYSAALRLVNGDVPLAEDVAQSVFTDLARKARELPRDTVLAGWLYEAARFAAAKAIRGERRRQAREQEALTMQDTAAEPTPDWEQLRPVLDAAMGELSALDRNAILLRYFQSQDFHAVGLALGISDDAAQKRVSRAVDRLREFLAKRGVTLGASGLVIVISAHAVEAAPVGLAVAISAAALSAGAATLVTTTTFLAMRMLNAKFVAFLLAAFLFGGAAYFVWEQKLRPAQAKPDPAAAGALATNEMLYREMIAAGPIAGEVVESHPTHIYWQERRTALLQAGYIETRDIPLSKALSARGATRIFFDRFQKHFRGVQMGVRGLGNGDTPPIAYVTARKTDLGPTGAVEQFVRNYDPDKP